MNQSPCPSAAAGSDAIEAIGAVMSIHVTDATLLPVFPAASTNSNVKLPLLVNSYVFKPSLLVIVTVLSSITVRVAVTPPLVGSVVLYSTEPVGCVVSSTITALVLVDALPDESTALYVTA